MYYSVISISQGIVTMEDPYGDIMVTGVEFFDYEPHENDIVTLKNEKFAFDEIETQHVKEINYNRLQNLLDKHK